MARVCWLVETDMTFHHPKITLDALDFWYCDRMRRFSTAHYPPPHPSPQRSPVLAKSRTVAHMPDIHWVASQCRVSVLVDFSTLRPIVAELSVVAELFVVVELQAAA
jgi:hypothetical protein